MEKHEDTAKREATVEKLLSSIKPRLMLSAFGEPGSPSDIAKRLGLPANVAHYWAGKLVDAGLLRQVEQRGRQRIYQAASDKIDAVPVDCGLFGANMSSALHAAFLAAAEHQDRIEPCDDSPEASGKLSMPQMRISELSMSRADYESVVGQLLEGVPSEPPEPTSGKNVGGETYTLAVMAFRGRISDHL